MTSYQHVTLRHRELSKRMRALGITAFFLSAIATTGANAQGTTNNQPNDSNAIEEIIVTASKRGGVSAQSLASSITAFDANKIERLDALDFDDFIVQVPGTNFLDNGGPGRGNEVASIRGLSPVADNTLGVVAQYLDGSPRFGRNYRLFDIGEVSVLRGPQGTLWGAQSIGGLISFRSNRPDTEQFDAEVQGDTYSSSGDGGLSYRIGGHVNIPIITDTFAIRAAGHYIDESGYIDNVTTGANDINAVDEKAWRISALYAPTDSSTFTLIYHGNDLHTDAPTFFDLDKSDRKVDWAFSQLPTDQNFDLVNLIADVDLSWASFNYTGSYYSNESEYIDYPRNVFGFIPLTEDTTVFDEESWTHEVRLASIGDGRVHWIAGLYFDDLDQDDTITSIEITESGNPFSPAIFDGFEVSVFGGPQTFKETAIFGEIGFDLSDRFSLLVGGRYFDWSVDNDQQTTFFGTDFNAETGEVGDDDFFSKVQLDFRLNDDMLFYVLRSEGFRFGGFNPFVGPILNIPEEFIIFQPDTLVNYEGGFKSVWQDGRLIFNVSVYFMDWQDIQTVVFNETSDFAFTTNGPDLEANGAEFELTMQDLGIEGLYAAFTFAYNENEFQDDALIFPGVPFLISKGDELRRTPRNTWSADLGYDFTLFNGDAFVRLNYWHKDATTTEGFNGNDGIVPIPAQDVVNTSFGINFEKWRAKLYIDNLGDETPLLQVFPNEANPAEASTASSIRPRTVGLELTFRFGK